MTRRTLLISAATAAIAVAQWYPEAGLGLFVHWGMSTVQALRHFVADDRGPRVGPAPSHARRDQTAHRESCLEIQYNAARILEGRGKIQSTRIQSEKWLKQAKDAGFRYAVLTTRPRDGFALCRPSSNQAGMPRQP
jgi:alpha-L-fucosidase